MDLMLALRDASRQDSQLASAQAQLRAVQQRLPQAQSLFLPTVNASANYAQQVCCLIKMLLALIKWQSVMQSPSRRKYQL